MHKAVENLLTLIRKGKLLGPATFDGLNIDSCLDIRDQPPFDPQWMQVNEQIEAMAAADPIDEQTVAQISSVAEAAFKTTFKLSASSDLAGYISDDFELIAKALSLGFEHEWLNALLQSYCKGQFPKGELEPRPGRLADVLEHDFR